MYILYVRLCVHSGDTIFFLFFSLYIYYNRFFRIFQIVGEEFLEGKKLIIGGILPGTNYTILYLFYYMGSSRAIRVEGCVVGPITSLYLHSITTFICTFSTTPRQAIYSLLYLPTYSPIILLIYVLAYLPIYYIYMYLPTYSFYCTIYV